MLSLFDEPVSLKGIRLIKAFTACLAGLEEERQIPQASLSAWATPIAESGASEAEMQQVGTWFAKHHQTPPSLSYILFAVRVLKNKGELPPHRMATPQMLEAMEILRAVERLGISSDDSGQSLILAGTLAHLAFYRQQYPNVNRTYLRNEIEGMARMSDAVADEILDEIQRGEGDLKSLEPYLFGARQMD